MSLDERHCAIRNWNDKETVISFYFKTTKGGNMNLALQAKGKSDIEVSLLGKKKKVTLNSETSSRVELGTFKVKTPGYIKMDVRGLKINQGSDFGSIASVTVSGDVCPVA